MNLSAQLIKDAKFKPEEIAVFDPQEFHFYQPSYTLIAGGLLGNVEKATKREPTYTKRPMRGLFNKNVNFQAKKVTRIDPKANSIYTA